MFDENALSRDQTVVSWGGASARLFLKRRFRLIMAFDRCHAVQRADYILDAIDQPLRRGKLGCTSMIRGAPRIGFSEV